MVAPASSRPNGVVKRGTSMRPPMASRPGVNRAQTATPTLHGRASPADSMIAKHKSPKRKAQEAGLDLNAAEETNINVVVRCRGRNDREVRENSAVVVSSDGIRGKKVELSMGPNALSNKAYQFDKVFSPAADQGMIFEDVVMPILDNLLAGLNCTIFAYGQTGTGKTYTMSGDITDMLPIPEAAGIIPRVLHTLFDRLNQDDNTKLDTTVKCSFIELYNEELRDLLAYEQNAKLKIFDEANKNGRTTTLVQGMVETHIENASKGIQLLREGSHKRQVAATKCNDLSSRSHTVFTMTVYTKRNGDAGDELIAAGKLNLVDLAGSENIGRSGAENQRATEAGLINKSLLTLGRVINALVDRSSHIPYRESKLTRLLQDSLGGHTKTCIIATLSPAKSNLEETISTLDYAFRAKNIRNKPQMNQLVSKKTLLREFTSEIEKLKSELIATRHRNGFYLSAEAYEELTTESESRRILSEEQRDKIETMEANLRNKVQELYALTTNYQTSRKENEKVRGRLDSTRDILDKTEIVLAHAKRSLAEQTQLRKAHQVTEEKLAALHGEMKQTLDETTNHVHHLHQNIDKRVQVHESNASQWRQIRQTVHQSTSAASSQLGSIHARQKTLISALGTRVQEFVKSELNALDISHSSLAKQKSAFARSYAAIADQGATMQSEMDNVLDEVHSLRNNVKEKVGVALQDLTDTAQRIGVGIASELEAFHTQMEDSHAALSRQLQTSFDDLVKRMHEQQSEIEVLRKQNEEARAAYIASKAEARDVLAKNIADEQETGRLEREGLVATIAKLLQDTVSKQERRMVDHLEMANKRIKISDSEYHQAQRIYDEGMDRWSVNTTALQHASVQHRDLLQGQIKAQCADEQSRIADISETTNAVHHGTMQAVDSQMAHMDSQLSSLDEIVLKVKAQSEVHQQKQTSSLSEMVKDVQRGYASVERQVDDSRTRMQTFDDSISSQHSSLQQIIEELADDGEATCRVRQVRDTIDAHQLLQYENTGNTPARTSYSYPTIVPRTEPHDVIIDKLRSAKTADRSPKKSPTKRSPIKRSSPSKIPVSPSKTLVYSDVASTSPPPAAVTTSQQSPTRTTSTLQDIDVNVISLGTVARNDRGDVGCANEVKLETATDHGKQELRPVSVNRDDSMLRKKRSGRTIAAEGRENVTPGLSFNTGAGGARRSLRNRVVDQS